MSSAEKRSHDRDVAPELREQALALDARQALGRFYPPKERVEPEDEAMEVIEDPRVRFTEGEAMRAKILALFPELTDPEFMAESPDTRIESVVAASWDKALELLKAIGYMPADDVSDVQFADPEALAEGRVEPLVDEDRIPSLPSRQWVVDTFVQSLSPQQKIELLRMERPVFFFEPIVRVDHFLSQLSDRDVSVQFSHPRLVEAMTAAESNDGFTDNRVKGWGLVVVDAGDRGVEDDVGKPLFPQAFDSAVSLWRRDLEMMDMRPYVLARLLEPRFDSEGSSQTVVDYLGDLAEGFEENDMLVVGGERDGKILVEVLRGMETPNPGVTFRPFIRLLVMEEFREAWLPPEVGHA